MAEGVVSGEQSRQAPLRQHPKHLLKRTLRGYRIEAKVRFIKPFYRFWFGYVAPFAEALAAGEASGFEAYYQQHGQKLYALLFEQLSNLLLIQAYASNDPIVSHGSYWDHHSEFDLLCVTTSGRIILGECKYTARKVTRRELSKLKEKAVHSGIRVDTYALFSKSGFSNELLALEEDDALRLFDLGAFSGLISSF